MPAQEKSVTSRKELSPQYPGLVTASLTFRLGSEAFRFTGFRDAATSWKAFAVHKNKKMIRGTVPSDKALPKAHGHLEASDTGGKQRPFIFNFEVVPGSVKAKATDDPSVSRVPAVLSGFLTDPAAPIECLVGASFELSLRAWRPSVSLPWKAPDTLVQTPGRPQVVGLDFEFEDPAHPVARAFVSVFPRLDKLIVKLLLRSSVILDGSTVTTMCEEAMKHVPLFAQRGTSTDVR